jgi:hypothetical protein
LSSARYIAAPRAFACKAKRALPPAHLDEPQRPRARYGWWEVASPQHEAGAFPSESCNLRQDAPCHTMGNTPIPGARAQPPAQHGRSRRSNRITRQVRSGSK